MNVIDIAAIGRMKEARMAVLRSASAMRGDECCMMLPRRSLAGCIYAAVVRDTRGMSFVAEDRVNYFPATPFCAVSLFFEGQSIMATNWRGADIHAPLPSPLPATVFSGPHGRPTVSLNPGTVYAMSIGFYPEAIQELLGVNISRYRDHILPAETVLTPPLLQLCDSALAAGDAISAFERFQDGLDPQWQLARPRKNPASHWLSDWTHHMLQQAATSGAGRSLRQIERRMKSWTGQSHRDLATLGRLETAFAEMMQRTSDDKENWAQLAIASGFSDQPHLVREVRRVTGFPPAQLRRRIKTDRAFWYYRLIGELY